MNIRKRNVYIAKIAILSALSFVTMIFEVPLPMFPLFLKMDLSEVAVLIGTFALGPVSGIVIELIKNLLHLTITTSAGIGELANFIVGTSFIATAGIIYKFKKTRRVAFTAMIIATSAMTLAAAIANYYILIPMYQKYLKFPDPRNVLISDIRTLVMFGIIPFNFIKGIIISFIVAILYKRVSPILHRE